VLVAEVETVLPIDPEVVTDNALEGTVTLADGHARAGPKESDRNAAVDTRSLRIIF